MPVRPTTPEQRARLRWQNYWQETALHNGADLNQLRVPGLVLRRWLTVLDPAEGCLQRRKRPLGTTTIACSAKKLQSDWLLQGASPLYIYSRITALRAPALGRFDAVSDQQMLVVLPRCRLACGAGIARSTASPSHTHHRASKAIASIRSPSEEAPHASSLSHSPRSRLRLAAALPGGDRGAILYGSGYGYVWYCDARQLIGPRERVETLAGTAFDSLNRARLQKPALSELASASPVFAGGDPCHAHRSLCPRHAVEAFTDSEALRPASADPRNAF